MLGRGGFGEVFEARDVALDRAVAIKRLLASPDPAQGERFQREARAVANLDHPNIVRVYDVGIDGEAPVPRSGAARRRNPRRSAPPQRCAALPIALKVLIGDDNEFPDLSRSVLSTERPSIVATASAPTFSATR